VGVCGKNPQVAALQDLLVFKLRELSQHALQARKTGWQDTEVDAFAAEALFVTLTNVNFDPQAIVEYIKKTAQIHEQLHKKTGVASTHTALETSIEGLAAQGKLHGIQSEPAANADLHSLQWLLTFGLKGVAAYAHHAYLLGKKRPKSLRLHLRRLSRALKQGTGRKRIRRLGFQMRRNKHPRHGAS
jgi:hydroxylamine reductase